MLMQIMQKVTFKNRVPFTDCIISKINNMQVMLMYNLIEYKNNDSTTFRGLQQYCRDEPAVNHDNTAEINTNNATTDLFKLKACVRYFLSNFYFFTK